MEETVNKWVTYLYKASVYSYYIEEQIKKKHGNLTEITEISSKSIISKAEQSEIIEIKDEIEMQEEDDPLKYYNRPFTYEIPLPVQLQFKTRQNNFDPLMPSIKEYNLKTAKYADSLIISLDKSEINSEDNVSFTKLKFSESLCPKPTLEKIIEEKICFNSFIILKTLGSGSFGKVYLVKLKKKYNYVNI